VKIGSEVSILKYESIVPGSDAHQKIGMRPLLRSWRRAHTPWPESLSLWFPFWKELHKHWRTLPHYNEFWDGGPRTNLVDRHIPEDPPQKGNSGRSRAPSKKFLLSNEGENRYPTGSNSREARKNVSKNRQKPFTFFDNKISQNSEVIIIDELPTKDEDECYPRESSRYVSLNNIIALKFTPADDSNYPEGDASAFTPNLKKAHLQVTKGQEQMDLLLLKNSNKT